MTGSGKEAKFTKGFDDNGQTPSSLYSLLSQSKKNGHVLKKNVYDF